MTSSLVGSEMCIRDSSDVGFDDGENYYATPTDECFDVDEFDDIYANYVDCLLYTSDAADDM
eukprot:10007695-Prorocentrum_lima.AAC.1